MSLHYVEDSKGWAHVSAQPGDGTFYSLVLTVDPYGGILVVWPSTGEVWRYYPADYELVVLTRHDVNPYSTKAVKDIMGELNVKGMFKTGWGR